MTNSSGNPHLQKALGSNPGSMSSLSSVPSNSFNNAMASAIKSDGVEVKSEPGIQIKQEPSEDSMGGKPVPGLNSIKLESGGMTEVKSEPFEVVVKQEEVKAEVKQENGSGDSSSSDAAKDNSNATSRPTNSAGASAPPTKPRVKKGSLSNTLKLFKCFLTCINVTTTLGLFSMM